MKLSIIIPAYNEEKRIGNTLNEYCKFLKKEKVDFEIIVVINNTTDKTEDIVKKYSKQYSEIRYLNLKEGGKGFAIIEGFKDALKRNNNLIGFVDADMSNSPQSFYDLIKNIKDFDGIIASRRMKESKIEKRIYRTIVSFTFNFIVRILFLLPYKDTQCGAKLFKRKAIEETVNQLTAKGWNIDIDLLSKLKKNKLKILEFPTVWEDKAGSKIGNIFVTSLKMFFGLIKMKFEK